MNLLGDIHNPDDVTSSGVESDFENFFVFGLVKKTQFGLGLAQFKWDIFLPHLMIFQSSAMHSALIHFEKSLNIMAKN